MNYADAKVNCANKMARYGKGRLYEPKSLDSSETVAAKANELSLDNYFLIGVNDIVQPDTHVYDSNSMSLSFTPKWFDDNDHLPGNNDTCINVCSFDGPWLGDWMDFPCTNNHHSVCE